MNLTMKKKVFNCNIQKAIGYKEINDYIKNKFLYQRCLNNIILNTKKYSKRQLTWFNNRYNHI